MTPLPWLRAGLGTTLLTGYSLSLLLRCVALLIAFWTVFRILRMLTRNMPQKSGTCALIAPTFEAPAVLRPFLIKGISGSTNRALLIVLVLLGLGAISEGWRAVSYTRLPVYEDHDVYVEQVLDEHTWMVKSPTRGEYQIVFCDNPHNNAVLDDVDGQAGYRLDIYRWQVTGTKCSNVSEEDTVTGPLGFWWHKENGIVVKIAAVKKEK